MTGEKEAAWQEKVNEFRDASGRFSKGNPGGPGNPFARFTAQMRKAFAEEATADDLRAVARSLLDKAKEGDVSAAKLVLSYTLGKPLEGVDPDRLDELECTQWRRENVTSAQAAELMSGMGATMLCQLLRGVIPILSQVNWQTLADGLHAAVEADKQQRAEEEKAAAAESEKEPAESQVEVAEPSELGQENREAVRQARERLGEGQILPIRPVADDKRTSGNGRAANPPTPERDRGNGPGQTGPPPPR